MDFFAKVLEVFDASMVRPQMYGIFHLSFFIVSIVAGIILCKLKPNPDVTFVRKLLLAVSIVVIVLEIYKQINYSFSYADGITFDYQWYAFPFQFCSTPMYIGLLASLIKKEKLHNALCSYLATFALFAGLCVMFYPVDIYISTIGINIQTSVCHGSMITLGIYLLGSGYVKREHKTILSAVPVFASLVGAAAIMNEIAYFTGLLENETFNMFFISPHCDPSLPVYSLVQAVVPFPFCLIIYIVAFSLAAYIMLLISILIESVFKKKKQPADLPTEETEKEEITV